VGPVNISVITYGDHEFGDFVGDVLAQYDNVQVRRSESLDVDILCRDESSVVLVNADHAHLFETRMEQLSKLVGALSKNVHSVVLMLTRNLNAADFLRYQVYRVDDTIDIAGGGDILKSALDTFLSQRQSSGPEQDREASSERS